MPTPMAQLYTLPGEPWGRLALATPRAAAHDAGGLARLPDEWSVLDGIVLEDRVIDHVVIGPNGLFTVTVDPNLDPATVEYDGLYRDGERVTTTVKGALHAAFELRARIGSQHFAYPLLVSPIEGDRAHLDRLGVIPGNRIAEAIWSHPGRPLRRSSRLEAVWALRGLAG